MGAGSWLGLAWPLLLALLQAKGDPTGGSAGALLEGHQQGRCWRRVSSPGSALLHPLGAGECLITRMDGHNAGEG